MPVSERERTAIANIRGWQNTVPEQFVEELASLSQETNRIPDPYTYLISPQGELFSPTANCLVKDDKAMDKTSPLGQLEYQAVLATEQWAASSSEGVSVWISPPKANVYPTSKIIIQEIQYEDGVKKVFNRAIVLDCNEEECMRFAWNLTSFSQNKPVFKDVDQIRAVPLILNTDKPWIDILEKLIDAPKAWAMIRNGEDKQYKKEALKQATEVQKQFFANNRVLAEASNQFDYYGGRQLVYHEVASLSYSDEAKMAIMQMLGNHSGSCPPRSSSGSRTAFQTVAGSAVAIGRGGLLTPDSKGERTFPCPACGYINERPYEGFVESCQNPGNCPDRSAVRC
ncbi:hypothetical protein M1437_02865 [Patescibacteria group bacterium]|nr:hypothetical protein [Patescibacteria group bacterium]